MTDPALLRQARELRDRHVSLRMIAALTGLPKSTVGDHLRGIGDPGVVIRCEQCEEEFVAMRSDKRTCSRACYFRWRRRNDPVFRERCRVDAQKYRARKAVAA